MLNNICLMGRMVYEPELKTTQNGTSVITFKIAVDRTYNREETDFITIVAWRNTAEFVAKYMSKGSLIAVEGSLQTRQYEDKQGNKRTAYEVVANNVHFAESKSKNNAIDNVTKVAKSAGVPVQQDFEEITDDVELPF